MHLFIGCVCVNTEQHGSGAWLIGAHTSESVAGSSRDVASITDVLLLRAQFGKRWLVVEEHEEEGNTNLWQMPSFFCS